MEKKLSDPSPAEPQKNEPSESGKTPQNPAPAPPDEEHSHGNYWFALKVLCVLIAIIVIIVVLKASGVPIAIKDWLAHIADFIQPALIY